MVYCIKPSFVRLFFTVYHIDIHKINDIFPIRNLINAKRSWCFT